jgi:hypothetical protein
LIGSFVELKVESLARTSHENDDYQMGEEVDDKGMGDLRIGGSMVDRMAMGEEDTGNFDYSS